MITLFINNYENHEFEIPSETLFYVLRFLYGHLIMLVDDFFSCCILVHSISLIIR
jgi:hypothetical protein